VVGEEGRQRGEGKGGGAASLAVEPLVRRRFVGVCVLLVRWLSGWEAVIGDWAGARRW
jgi:hypothetical protein